MTSNMLSFHDCAAGEDSSGLVVMGGSGSGGGVGVFLITTQDVSVGQELMFWAHDPTLAWSRKKMEKTSECCVLVEVVRVGRA